MSKERAAAEVTENILDYYRRPGSRLIYGGILGGVRHLGYYEPGDHIWEFAKTQRQMQGHLAAELDLAPGSQVLDAGCGTGAVAAYLAKNRGLNVVGIDLVAASIKRAKARAATEGVVASTDFIEGNYTTVELGESAFDGIYTMETLVHVPDAAQALARFHSLLKSGGRLAMHEYSHEPEAFMPADVYAAMTEINRLVVMPGFQDFEHGTLESLTQDAGFNGVESRDITANITPMMKAFSLLMRVPYGIAKRFSRFPNMPNAMTAVEIYKNRPFFRYNTITANKPDRE